MSKLFTLVLVAVCFAQESSSQLVCKDQPGVRCSRFFCRFPPFAAVYLRRCPKTCDSRCRNTPTTSKPKTTPTPAPTPGPWSACTKSCGGGTRTRTRACTARNPNTCPRQRQNCNTQICPLAFNSWSPCSRSCGTGTRFRVRRCPANNIDTCPRQFQDCNTRACPNARCRRPEMFRYGMRSECCRRDQHPCGTNNVMNIGARIIGGTASDMDRWPWMVRLEVDRGAGEFSICGGALVNLEYAVTAAHCVSGFNRDSITAFAAFGTGQVQERKLRSSIVHPQHDQPLNDIAVIRFTTPLQSNNFVRPICLPRKEEAAVDKHCYIAGWGSIETATIVLPTNLQEARIRILPYRVCAQAYENDPDVGDKLSEATQICAGSLTGTTDSCHGDSGGPIMCQRCSSCNWYMAGVVSFGPLTCGTPNEPGVYTRVTAYEDWIEGIVGRTQPQTFSCPS